MNTPMDPRNDTDTTADERASRVQTTVVIITAGLVGLLLGMQGVSWALWSDEIRFDGGISQGSEFFAAGRVGETQPATDGQVRVSIGPDEAAALMDQRRFAVPLHTESVSQGIRGLRYEISLPDWGEDILATATIGLAPVDTPDQCTVDTPLPEDSILFSTPVTAQYSDTTTPTDEYWCLIGVGGTLPGEGSHSSTAEVTATDEAGAIVTDHHTWEAEISSDTDPAAEPVQYVTFTYQSLSQGE